eukprot:SAG31_NODE_3084_length_4695_cov_3.336741_3_plen_70_part_00
MVCLHLLGVSVVTAGSGVRALAALPADILASGGTDGSITLWQVGPAIGWYGIDADHGRLNVTSGGAGRG